MYTQSSTALYSKLRKTIDESCPEGWNLVDQEDITCDGYKVLCKEAVEAFGEEMREAASTPAKKVLFM